MNICNVMTFYDLLQERAWGSLQPHACRALTPALSQRETHGARVGKADAQGGGRMGVCNYTAV